MTSISISTSTALYFRSTSNNLISKTINNSIKEISIQKELEIINQLSDYFKNTNLVLKYSLRTILGVISIYPSLLNTLISSINRNNRIIIRAAFIFVHNIFAR